MRVRAYNILFFNSASGLTLHLFPTMASTELVICNVRRVLHMHCACFHDEKAAAPVDSTKDADSRPN